LTFGVVERALREVHFAVHLAKSAKQQALIAIKVLEQSFPIQRAKMRIRVEVSASADCTQVPPSPAAPRRARHLKRGIQL
jgi:ribosome maturation protein Sdo1